MPTIRSIIDDLITQPIEKTGHIYHPIPFKEFDRLKTSSKPKSAYRKWEMIIRALPTNDFRQFRVLDIGANAGFYSYQFAKHGATVDAFEPTPRYARLGRDISAAYKLPIRWYAQRFTEDFLANQPTYDIALMLSVFQWMSEGNSKLGSATVTLRAIAQHTRYLFFELGCNGGKSSIQIKGSGLQWVWKLLNANTNHTTIAYLGSVRAWNHRNIRHQFVCTSEALSLNLWQKTITTLLRLTDRLRTPMHY